MMSHVLEGMYTPPSRTYFSIDLLISSRTSGSFFLPELRRLADYLAGRPHEYLEIDCLFEAGSYAHVGVVPPKEVYLLEAGGPEHSPVGFLVGQRERAGTARLCAVAGGGRCLSAISLANPPARIVAYRAPDDHAQLAAGLERLVRVLQSVDDVLEKHHAET